jgi:protein-disulfide isomerase
MPSSFIPSRLLPALVAAAFLSAAVPSAPAQFAPPPPGTTVLDASALKPPAGARVAIVEFADLECPACAKANPLLKAAVDKYKIPWVRHDMLIPNHVWSTKAAVYARWFDANSKALGDEYRDQVFANQEFIYGPLKLRSFTEEFARSNGIALPDSVDPDGLIDAEVHADTDLGRRTGVTHTPTIFVVSTDSKGAHYVEVQFPDSQLDNAIAQALANSAAAR